MPKKKTFLSEAERRKRLRETAREVEAEGTGEDFERAFSKVASRRPTASQRQPTRRKAS